MSVLKKWDGIFIYITLIIGTLLLRLVGDYPDQVYSLARGFSDCAASIAQYFNLTDIMIALHNIPAKLVITILGGLQILIGFLVLCVFRNQMEQGAMILLKEWGNVLKSGLACYFMLGAIIGIFIYSLVGISVGATTILISQTLIFIGRIPLSIFLGYLLMERISISKGYTILYFFIGGFVMLFFECVYAIGGAFIFFVFPVFALGTLYCMIVNRYVFHISYGVDFSSKMGKKPFDRKKIKDIITKEL